MDIGPSEAETFWTAFLSKLARRSCAVKLVVTDAHEGIKATVAKVLNATWQRCRAHFMRNALAHAARAGGASSPPSSHRLRPGRRGVGQRPVSPGFRRISGSTKPRRASMPRRKRLHNTPQREHHSDPRIKAG